MKRSRFLILTAVLPVIFACSRLTPAATPVQEGVAATQPAATAVPSPAAIVAPTPAPAPGPVHTPTPAPTLMFSQILTPAASPTPIFVPAETPLFTPALNPEPRSPSPGRIPTIRQTPSPRPILSFFFKDAQFRLETAHFSIWTDPSYLEPLELERIAELLEKAFDQVTSFLNIQYDVKMKGKISVYFRAAAGLNFSTVQGFIVFSNYRNSMTLAPGVSMVHEITHIVTERHTDYMIRHLDAPYLEMKFIGTFLFPACGHTLHQQAAALLEARSLVPIAEIPANPAQWGFQPGSTEAFADAQRAHRFYTEAGSFGQYLIENYGVEALNRLRSRLDRSWTYAYNKSLAELQAEWLDLLERERKENPTLIQRLAQASQTTDPCQASRVIR